MSRSLAWRLCWVFANFSVVVISVDNCGHLSQNTLLASGLDLSHCTLLKIAGYIVALPLEGAENTPC